MSQREVVTGLRTGTTLRGFPRRLVLGWMFVVKGCLPGLKAPFLVLRAIFPTRSIPFSAHAHSSEGVEEAYCSAQQMFDVLRSTQ